LLEAGGPERVREVTRLAAPAVGRAARPIVVTGGAGFIGSNLADSYLAEGRDVVVVDNLSRPGVERNLRWLAERHGPRLHAVPADLRDALALREAVRDAEAVLHMAAQTAVTTSLAAPVDDFEVNARGTLNVLEAIRACGRRVPLVFASTNKVYGALADLAVADGNDACAPTDAGIRAHGVGEGRALDFCTPYGCSKGVADQYVLDYARSYDLPAAVLRMSCVYGPRQFGTEDQGWIAHFLIRALERRPITVYGTGRQVRDVLDVSDAVRAYRAVLVGIGELQGRAFNLGGGPTNAVSLIQVLREIEGITGRAPDVTFEDWRKGDQPWFVADTRALEAATGWRARIPWREGLRGLADWLSRDRNASEGEEADAHERQRVLA
jgi:CDP-paratose 2-epimerase